MKDITKETSVVYQIIETPCTAIDLKGNGSAVYSALALYREDDIITSRFIYDIARNKAQAEYLLARMRYIKPQADELCEFIAELL